MKDAREFVLDSSVALAWCFKDEVTIVTEKLFDQTAQTGFIAPLIWPAEVRNGLLMAKRRKRILSQEYQELMEFLEELLGFMDFKTDWTETSELAEKHHLTIYDATYLELALRRDLPLATLDEDLRKAAKKAGIDVWGK